MALFGLFGKKKKEEAAMPAPEMGLGREYELGLPGTETYGAEMPGALPGMPSEEAPHIGAPPGLPPAGVPASRYAPQAAAYAEPISSKDIELLSAKLDALKAILESINQRLTTLEQMAGRSREHERYY